MKKIFLIIIIVFFSNTSFADNTHSHKHKMIEANAPYPTLNVKLMKDAKDGYDLIIQTTVTFNFAAVKEKYHKH